MIDIVVSIRTSFIDKETGDEITNTRSILMNYLKNRFIIDFFAAFPMEIIALAFFSHRKDTIWLQLFSLFKLVRVSKLSGIITYLNLSKAKKTALRLMKLVLFILIFIH